MKPKQILIVEDDADLRAMLSELMEDEGYRVITANNGHEGLATLAAIHPSLIICDVMMPTLDGRKMCHIIRAHPEYAEIPIVMVSAADEAIKRQFTNIVFISKPFDTMALLDCIHELLGDQVARAVGQ